MSPPRQSPRRQRYLIPCIPRLKISLGEGSCALFFDSSCGTSRITMTVDNDRGVLCGIWVCPDGKVHLSRRWKGGRTEDSCSDFQPFLWANEPAGTAIELEGEGELAYLNAFESMEDYREFLKLREPGLQKAMISQVEHQYLLANGERLFDGFFLSDLKRCQCDIETRCTKKGGFSNPNRAKDRVLAIGLQFGDEQEILLLEEESDAGERALLERFNAVLKERDPDTIEGHNFFKFDLNYLKIRCKKLGVLALWGRFGQEARFRNSRIRVAERWIDFPRCDLPGRCVFDTYLMVQFYDLVRRDMPSYRLKDIARYFGLSSDDNRTYLDGDKIDTAFDEDREQFVAYLKDDLRETKGIADILLPTYFAQASNFPMTLQEITLRGAATKLDLLFLEKYYEAKHALPQPLQVHGFEGAFSKSFESGVFEKVLHFDVASLYPSLLLSIGRCPEGDSLEMFIPLLKELKEYRLRYKKRAKEAESAELRAEYDARQASFKVIINSFYGYLGFNGARFSDSDLAAEITAKGRALLLSLIQSFSENGCTVLEADTDGIYLASDTYFDDPCVLLKKIESSLPEGIELEFDGKYASMFCYKAKNYALYDGTTLTIRGSALRSRGIEPYLKELTDCLLNHLLGVEGCDPVKLAEEYRSAIDAHTMPVERLAKSEFLSQNPEKYKDAVEISAKPRRASLEVALTMSPMPRMGERVQYFIAPGEKAREPDWKRACALNQFDPKHKSYDSAYYGKKLDDWLKRYAAFINTDTQQTLLF